MELDDIKITNKSNQLGMASTRILENLDYPGNLINKLEANNS